MWFGRKSLALPTPDEALPGRAEKMPVPAWHHVLRRRLEPPFPPGVQQAVFGMGCFWGAERKFWQAGDGIYTTAVGYAGGLTPNPTYREVCSGATGHTEVVLVAFEPDRLGYDDLLRLFWENHDPTQGMRQGNDVGTQYRSAIYWHDDAQEPVARAVLDEANRDLRGRVVTELAKLDNYWRAEDYHQHYFANHPNAGYCAFVVAPKVEKFRRTFKARLRA